MIRDGFDVGDLAMFLFGRIGFPRTHEIDASLEGHRCIGAFAGAGMRLGITETLDSDTFEFIESEGGGGIGRF